MKNHSPDNIEKQPWLERQDWAKGIADDTVKSASSSELWFATIFFAIFLIPFGIVLYSHFLETDPNKVWVAAIPPGLSLCMFFLAVAFTYRRRKQKTWLELKTLPGILGGFLRGTVHTTVPLHTVKHLRFQLICFEICRVKNSRFRPRDRWDYHPTDYHGKVLHFEEGTIPVKRINQRKSVSTFPLEIGIPYTCKETKLPPNSPWIEWRLRITAQEIDDKLEADFHVPVFMTAESNPEYSISSTHQRPQNIAKALYDVIPRYAGVRVQQDQHGKTFYFGPARCVDGSVFATLITLLICSATTILYMFDINLIIVSFFGLLSTYSIIGTLHSWLYTTIVRIESGVLTFRQGYLGIFLSKKILFNEINGVKTEKIGADFHKQKSKEYNDAESSSVSHDLVLLLKNKNRIRIAKYLRRKHHATWLAEKMRAAIHQMR